MSTLYETPRRELDGREMFNRLFEEMEAQLRRKASLLCNREQSPSFATGDLLSSLYLRLSRDPHYALAVAERGRLEFLYLASKVMQHILADAARRRIASKRGGSFAFVSLSHADERAQLQLSPEALLALDTALTGLEEKHPRRAAIIRMRFYSGLTIGELREYWGLADATVERDIRLALKLLYILLDGRWK